MMRTEDRYIPVVALDCEMVGYGSDGNMHALGRVSIVNEQGRVLIDELVKPAEEITDYRTSITGLRPQQLAHAIPFPFVRDRVVALLRDRIVVGHAVHNDFDVMSFHPPTELIRDTSSYKPLRSAKSNISLGTHGGIIGRHPSSTATSFRRCGENSPSVDKKGGSCLSGNTPSLKKLVKHWFNEETQGGVHDSVEDARMAMRLYLLVRHEWEIRHAPVLRAYLTKWNIPTNVVPPDNLPLHQHSAWMLNAKNSLPINTHHSLPPYINTPVTDTPPAHHQRPKTLKCPAKYKRSSFNTRTESGSNTHDASQREKRRKTVVAKKEFSVELESNRHIAMTMLASAKRSRTSQ
eukprot:GHVQ01012120.1.p1 GENE.GHVQ01012120.1~~GHVQ01012120.1.p1  ORF type:complete len:349 (-),score=54.97 GHVQ01012120.1:653-1699(-)